MILSVPPSSRPRHPAGRLRLLVPLALILAGGCAAESMPPGGDAGTGTSARDIHSYARPAEARVRHMEIDWSIDFERQVLDGFVVLHLERADGRDLRLDSRDLEIIAAETAGDAADWAATDWRAGETDPDLGTELIVSLPDAADRVRVSYRTRPGATGLQWLAPAQTAGGRHPFLYSQAQAIHARSFVPCQDSPAVRFTFDARIDVAAPLRVVMAALDVTPGADARREAGSDGRSVYRFRMPHAIPSYLLAVAAGDLRFGDVGPRTGVWAEPAVLEPAVREFKDMEKMLEATEALYGPYRWDRYDILVLPPSFPFGGMENPMLTFATPTILAGDRSLVSLVAHELAHSWSGNLVTNATWSDFWLNEGFTTYIERRIMEAVYGGERARMEWMLGRQDLVREMQSFAETPGDQILHVDLSGRDPDDGMTQVPYEKGAHFLRRLEETYGRERFDRFLREWFDGHAFTSVTTADFVRFLHAGLLDTGEPAQGSRMPDIQAWIERPGLPGSTPDIRSGALDQINGVLSEWLAGRIALSAIGTADWTTQHWLHFLRALPPDLSQERLASLDAAFGLTATGNSEILDRWLELAILRRYEAAYPRLEEFLTSQGRRKFLTPLYQALVDSGQEERARRIYADGRPLYHAISRRTLDEILKWD